MNPINNVIIIPHAKGLSVVDIASIIRVEAAGSYSKLFLRDGRKIILSKVLRKLEKMLAEKGFVRVHRSHLINTAFVQNFNFLQLKVTMINNEEIPMSRRKSRKTKKDMPGFPVSWPGRQRHVAAA